MANALDLVGWAVLLDRAQPGTVNASYDPRFPDFEYVVVLNSFAPTPQQGDSVSDQVLSWALPNDGYELLPFGWQGTMTITVAGGQSGVLGDPQFTGLRGQSYQVHGIDGAVYNLISDVQVQLNTRFTFLDHGRCLRDGSDGVPLFTCWSHPGSYLGELALHTAVGDNVLIAAGAAETGFSSVRVNGKTLLSGDSVALGSAAVGLQPLTVDRPDIRTVTIAHAGLYTLTVENSDGFVNILALHVDHFQSLVHEVQSHGLLGQTWRSDQTGAEVKAVEGHIDDYVISEGDMQGCDFVYNKFKC